MVYSNKSNRGTKQCGDKGQARQYESLCESVQRLPVSFPYQQILQPGSAYMVYSNKSNRGTR
jgi:hypothetical protein